MVNKRGWLRIVEAFVSILIVFGTVMTISMTNRGSSDGSLCSTITPLLDEIAQREEYRIAILDNKPEIILDFVKNQIKNPSIEPEVRICEVGSALCTHTQSGIDYEEICAGERIISDSVSTAENRRGFEPKKVKIFLFKI